MELNFTLGIIVLTGLVSWLAFSNEKLLQRLLLWPPAVTRGREYHRFVSYGFVHGDFMRLLFNMITLYFFGGRVEALVNEVLGPWGFVGFYLSALVVSALPSYLRHRHDPNYATLGASGAVSAVLFAFILFYPWATIYVYVIPVPAIIFAALYVGYSVYAERQQADRINHSAHLAGAAYGVLFTLLMEPRVLGHFWQSLLNP